MFLVTGRKFAFRKSGEVYSNPRPRPYNEEWMERVVATQQEAEWLALEWVESDKCIEATFEAV